MRKFIQVDLVPAIAKKIKKVATADLEHILLRIEDALAGTPLDKLRTILSPIRRTPTGRIFVRELLGCFMDSMCGALQNSTSLLDSFINQILTPVASGSDASVVSYAGAVLEGFANSLDPTKLIISFGERMLHILVPFNLLMSIRPALRNLAAKTTKKSAKKLVQSKPKIVEIKEPKKKPSKEDPKAKPAANKKNDPNAIVVVADNSNDSQQPDESEPLLEDSPADSPLIVQKRGIYYFIRKLFN